MSRILIVLCFFCSHAFAEKALVSTIAKIKPSIVGVGTYQANARPQSVLQGTGFVFGNGQYIATNYHVIGNQLENDSQLSQVVFVGSGKSSEIRKVEIVAWSQKYDIAILKQYKNSLPAMVLSKGAKLEPEGRAIAFTGFPIGAVLGLYPVTHRGIIASITPVVIPTPSSKQLTPSLIKQLKNPYLVYQLDATAYPGNSGSPVYLKGTGEVIAIINKVFVQQSKEAIITNPSGITYAIPVKHLIGLAKNHKIEL